MGRPIGDKPTGTSHRDKNTSKKLIANKISGWESKDPFDDVGIVDWMKRQTIAESKRDKKNATPSKEDDEFRFSPKRKCTAIDNIEEFERESLHEKFLKRNAKKGKKPIFQKTEIGKENITSKNAAKSAKPNKRNNDSGKIVFESLKVKDDFEVGLHHTAQKQNKTKEEQEFPMKRSHSVPGLDRANTIHGCTQAYEKLRVYRLPKWNNGEHRLTEEDEDYSYDEGYVSKTPSAEEKESKHLEGTCLSKVSVSTNAGNDDNTPRTAEKVAKFSYTHQNAKELPSLVPAKTATEVPGPSRERRLLKASVLEAGLKSQERAQSLPVSSRNLHDTSYSLQEIRPVPLVMRRVTMQDSPVQSSGDGHSEYETAVVNSKPNSPLSNDGATNTERLQYPIHNNIQELKFSRTSGRPQSLQSTKGLIKAEGTKLTPEVDKNGSTSLPIGDLLPAVDKSIRNSHVVRTKRCITLSGNSVNMSDSENATSFVKSNECREYRINGQDESILRHSRPSDQPLGPPPFRSHQTRSPLQRAREIAERRIVGGQLSNKENNQNSTPRSGSPGRTTIGTPRHGPGFSPSPGVRLSSSINDDRATKKKLRDAFSRFYNRRPFENGSEWQT